MSTSPFSRTAVEVRLIQLAARGSPDAFAALFRQHFESVYNYALNLCGDPSLADDLTQEAFIRAHANLGRFGPPWKFRPWLFHTVRNLFVDHYRRERKSLELKAALPDRQPGPERRALSSELAARVRSTLRQLPSAHREALALRELDGFSYEEIAAILGVSLDNVKVLLHRARDKFRQTYGLRILAEDPLPSCPALGELLDALHDGQPLSAEQQRAVYAHLRECPTCQQRQRELAALSALLVLPPFAPPAALAARILEQVERGPAPRPAGRQFTPLQLGGMAGGGLLVLALAVFLLALLVRGANPAGPGAVAPVSPSPTYPGTSAALFHTATSDAALPILAPGSEASPTPSPTPTVTPTTTPRPPTITFTVLPPTRTFTPTPDTTGPAIGKVQSSQSTIYTGPATCSPAAAVITATVSDPSGVESVVLIYAHTTFGSIPMAHISGTTWRATLGPFSGVGDGTVDYQVRAYDSAGNYTDTSFKTLPILLCTG